MAYAEIGVAASVSHVRERKREREQQQRRRRRRRRVTRVVDTSMTTAAAVATDGNER